MNTETFDVIIIGGGVAGISAALWCDELGLDSILLESNGELGGQLLWTHNAIENHLGIKAENGKELCDIFVEQIKERNFKLNLNAKICEIDLKNKAIVLENGEKILTKAFVIGTGVRRRTLGIKGEKRFQGRGIIQSGKRDKGIVKEKKVLIVGGGDAALENAQILSETAAKVYVAHRREKFSAREEFIKVVRQLKNVELLTSTTLEEINGKKQIESVKLKQGDVMNSLLIDAVIIRIGVEANTELVLGQLELTKDGYIKINSNCETNLEGVFAVGDVANPISPTISSAVGMGATSVKAIYELLKI